MDVFLVAADFVDATVFVDLCGVAMFLLVILSLVRTELDNLHLHKAPFMCFYSLCNSCGFTHQS